MTTETVVEIGGTPVLLRSRDREVLETISETFPGFITSSPSSTPFELTVEMDSNGQATANQTGSSMVPRFENSDGQWLFERFDFRAEWSLGAGRGHVRHPQSGAYSIGSVLRIFHSIIAARQGGCLFHAASAARNGKAFVFPGISGAGKTTISRLAPPDAVILSDEISYIRPFGAGFRAFGTPFAGDLGKLGENTSAPLAAVYLLAQGPANRIEPLSPRDAVAALMRNILFFANEKQLVERLFETACRIAGCVPVSRLTFVPTPQVWDLIG